MKPSEIKVGATYEGPRGERRRVLHFVRHRAAAELINHDPELAGTGYALRADGGTWLAYEKGRGGGTCSLAFFAEWAQREVPAQPGTGAGAGEGKDGGA